MKKNLFCCLCALFYLWTLSNATGELPKTIDDLNLSITNEAPLVHIEENNGYLTLGTDWNPLFKEDAYIKIVCTDTTVYLYPYDDGLFISERSNYTNQTQNSVESITLISEGYSDDDSEMIILDRSGNLIAMDVGNNHEYLSYGLLNADTGLYGYAYAKESDQATYPVMQYSMTFDADGNLLTYRVSDENYVITQYDGQGNVTAVEAIVPALEADETFSRLYWDFDERVWRDKYGNVQQASESQHGPSSEIEDNREVQPTNTPYDEDSHQQTSSDISNPEVHTTPAPPDITKSIIHTTPAPQATSTENADSSAVEISPTPLPSLTPTSTVFIPVSTPKKPYIITAPPASLTEYLGANAAQRLQHLPLGNVRIYNNQLTMQDEGYEAVDIQFSQNGDTYIIPLQYDYATQNWVCYDLPQDLPPYNQMLISLYNQNGIQSNYLDNNLINSYYSHDQRLQLRSDSTYIYDGTGRENVIAVYDETGMLTSYSFHTEDGTKSITYTPYGDIVSYSVFASDGHLYQYDMSDGWKVETSQGSWVNCSQPEDVSMNELPPLLLWQRTPQEAVKYDWYKNNTVCVLGLSLRDAYPGLTKKWFHILPVDISQDGVQSFRLIASNMYYIGRVYVFIQDDKVVVDYILSKGHVYPKREFFRWFTSMDEISTEFLENPEGSWEFKKAYSREKDMNNQDIALLFICNTVTYRKPVTNKGGMLPRYYRNSRENTEIADKAKEMILQMELRYGR